MRITRPKRYFALKEHLGLPGVDPERIGPARKADRREKPASAIKDIVDITRIPGPVNNSMLSYRESERSRFEQ